MHWPIGVLAGIVMHWPDAGRVAATNFVIFSHWATILLKLNLNLTWVSQQCIGFSISKQCKFCCHTQLTPKSCRT